MVWQSPGGVQSFRILEYGGIQFFFFLTKIFIKSLLFIKRDIKFNLEVTDSKNSNFFYPLISRIFYEVTKKIVFE